MGDSCPYTFVPNHRTCAPKTDPDVNRGLGCSSVGSSGVTKAPSGEGRVSVVGEGCAGGGGRCRGRVCVIGGGLGGWDMWEISLHPPQVCCEPKPLKSLNKKYSILYIE